MDSPRQCDISFQQNKKMASVGKFVLISHQNKSCKKLWHW